MADRCYYCGVAVEAGSAKCGFCGAPLDVREGAQPPQFPSIPELYPNDSLMWYSWVQSPIFGCWCVWRNAKTLGDKKNELAALSLAAITLGMIFVFVPLTLCGLRAFGNILLLPTYLGFYFAVLRPHRKFIEQHDITYRRKPLWKPVLIALALNLAAAGAIFGILVALSE